MTLMEGSEILYLLKLDIGWKKGWQWVSPALGVSYLSVWTYSFYFVV